MPVPTGLRLVPLFDAALVAPQWSPKDPADIGVFGVDLTRVMRGPAIRRARARASSPVAAIRCTFVGAVVSVALQGGEDGQIARVELLIEYTDGQTDTWAILLPITAQGTLEVDTVAVSPITTPDNTPALLATFPLLAMSGAAATIQGTVLARNVATGEATSFAVTVVATNLGTPQASVSQQSVTAFECPASLASCALTVGVSSNIVSVFCTGIPSGQVAWTPDLEVIVA